MKRRLVLLTLVFEFLVFTLSGCVLKHFDIAALRYFKPQGCSVKEYKIAINEKSFEGIRISVEKVVLAKYITNDGKIVELKSAQFKNSFEMHEFWHKWVRKNFSFSKALESEWWWFSGRISTSGVAAWYHQRIVFIISCSDETLLNKTKKELDVFLKVFSEVKF